MEPNQLTHLTLFHLEPGKARLSTRFAHMRYRPNIFTRATTKAPSPFVTSLSHLLRQELACVSMLFSSKRRFADVTPPTVRSRTANLRPSPPKCRTSKIPKPKSGESF